MINRKTLILAEIQDTEEDLKANPDLPDDHRLGLETWIADLKDVLESIEDED